MDILVKTSMLAEVLKMLVPHGAVQVAWIDDEKTMLIIHKGHAKKLQELESDWQYLEGL